MGVKRLSFATAEQTMALTGMMVGGVTPFGLPEGLPLYIDSRVMGQSEHRPLAGVAARARFGSHPAVLEKASPSARVVDELALSG